MSFRSIKRGISPLFATILLLILTIASFALIHSVVNSFMDINVNSIEDIEAKSCLDYNSDGLIDAISLRVTSMSTIAIKIDRVELRGSNGNFDWMLDGDGVIGLTGPGQSDITIYTSNEEKQIQPDKSISIVLSTNNFGQLSLSLHTCKKVKVPSPFIIYVHNGTSGLADQQVSIFQVNETEIPVLHQITDDQGFTELYLLPDWYYASNADDSFQTDLFHILHQKSTPLLSSMAKNSVSIRVVNANGDPLDRISVLVTDTELVETGESAISDTDGIVTFRLGDGSYRFKAIVNEEIYWSQEIKNQGTDEVVSIYTYSEQPVSPQIKFGSSLAPGGFNVYVYDINGAYYGSTITNDTGHFTRTLPNGLFFVRYYDKLTFKDSDSGYFSTASPEIIVSMGGGTVQIKLLAGSDAVAEGTTVRLIDGTNSSSWSNRRSDTNSSGEVMFKPVPAGNYRLRNDYKGLTYYSEIFTFDGTPVELNYGGGNLTLRIMTLDSIMRPDTRVRLWRNDSIYSALETKINESGWISYQFIPSGSYKLEIVELVENKFTVLFNHFDENPYVFYTSGQRFVSKITIGNEPVPEGAIITLWPKNSSWSTINSYVNASGYVDFGGIPYGNYSILFRWEGIEEYSDLFHFTGQMDINIEGEPVVGKITVNGVNLPEGARIRIYDNSSSYSKIIREVNATGWVSFRSLPYGVYYFEVIWLYLYKKLDSFTHDGSTHQFNIPGGSLTIQVNIGESLITSGARFRLYTNTSGWTDLTAYSNDTGYVTFQQPIPYDFYKLRIEWLGIYDVTDVFEHNGSIPVINIPGSALSIQVSLDGSILGEGELIRIILTGQNWSPIYTYTNASGWVNFPSLPFKSYYIRIDIMSSVLSGDFTHSESSYQIDITS